MIFKPLDTVLRQPVECIVRVDGDEIYDLYPYLQEVKVEMSREAAATATLVFDTLRDETGSWLVQDMGGSQPLLLPWRKVIIEAAFGRHKEEVMRGYIREVTPDYPQDMSAASVTVIVQDESILLDREQVRRSWVTTDDSAVSDADIVKMIASDHQLETEVQPGLENTSLSSNGTYVQLIRERAEVNGYEFYVREGVIHFHPPELEGESQASVMVYAGTATNCLKFSASFDGHKPDEISLSHAPEEGTIVEEEKFTSNLALLGNRSASSEDMGFKPFSWKQDAANGFDSLETNARAQAKANENAWKVIAEGELDGALYGHVLLNFKLVYVDGTGETMGGLYYVDSVQHHFSQQGYRQGFKLLRNAIGDQGNVATENPLASVIGGLF